MPLKANQIALIVLTAVAVFLYWQKYQDVYKDTGRLQISQEGDAVILSWSSSIELPMEHRFQEAYAEWADKTDKFIINLDSGGGALREGRLVIDVIDQMKKTHLVETNVGEGAYCLSMCVPIYLHGEKRSASKNSQWMFHEPAAYDLVTDEKVEENEYDKQAAATRYFEKYFVNSEMDPTWRAQLQKDWVGKDVWYTGQQLKDQRSNIILRLY